MQRTLDEKQVEAFYHDGFVRDQVMDFQKLVGDVRDGVVVDVGGGRGYFASALNRTMGIPTRVLDTDKKSVEFARASGIEAVEADALAVSAVGDERIVCFNLILHHLVSESEQKTRRLQIRALRQWADQGRSARIFVNEYIYESFLGNLSGALIYRITSSSLLSRLASLVARIAPSLRANTFGVGVRFRSNQEWKDLFSEAGLILERESIGRNEIVSLPRRLLCIESIRRDSFLLKFEA